jgi:hypothetical protein
MVGSVRWYMCIMSCVKSVLLKCTMCGSFLFVWHYIEYNIKVQQIVWLQQITNIRQCVYCTSVFFRALRVLLFPRRKENHLSAAQSAQACLKRAPLELISTQISILISTLISTQIDLPQLNSAHLNSTQLNSTQQNSTQPKSTLLNSTGVNWFQLSWIMLSWLEFSIVELSWDELNSVELRWVDNCWAEMSWFVLNWVYLS